MFHIIEAIKNFLKKFLPPPVKAFNREMSALDQHLMRLERQILEQKQQLLALDKKLVQQGQAQDRKLAQQTQALDKKLAQQTQALDKRLEQQTQAQNKKLEQQTLTLDKKLARIPGISRQLYQMKQADRSVTPQPRLSYFEFSIVDHCNLNCKGCNHFACIAEERYVPAEKIRQDLNRLSELLHGAVTRIGVMGGEPLLHPDLLEILAATRAAFPNTEILLFTNGLLLLKMSEDFWTCCRENNIVVNNTKYPIDQDYEGMQRTAAEHDVRFQFWGIADGQKTLWKHPLDLDGRQDPVYSFWACDEANKVVNLDDGRLYTCPQAPSIRIFNQKYGTHLEWEPGDYLDIYKAQSADEVFRFLSTPNPFCRYCAVSKRVFGLPWEQSKQEMSEWLPD